MRAEYAGIKFYSDNFNKQNLLLVLEKYIL